MARASAWRPWRHGRIREALASGLRFVLAFAGIMAVCWVLDWTQALIPLLLGVIASALAETDDDWRGRSLAMMMTLLSFALVIAAVHVSLSRPTHLMSVFVAAAFLLTLLGALGGRYRAIATATLIMSLYAAMAIDPQARRPLAQGQDLLLLAGAAWYGLVSVLWSAALPKIPVEQNLARLYDALGRYLELKSRMFEPVRGIDLDQRRLALALHNGRVVDALNATKESLLGRCRRERPPAWQRLALSRYFVAQDVHERTSSSHEKYAVLADTFFHSDVLYRCERVLALLGADCLALADALRKHEQCSGDGATARAIEDMEAAVAHAAKAAAASSDVGKRALHSLRALAANLAAIAREIRGVLEQEPRALPVDTTLQDTRPRSLRDFGKRLHAQLSLESALMRHAIRLSLALLAGHALMLATGDTHGFWILLTIVFVCQPQYVATLTRLIERIGGTLLGLLIGWALLRLFPADLAQAAFTVAAGVLFFMLRSTRYALATAAITTLVLLAFNQVSDGYGLILPRLLDTLAGTLIAGIAAWLVLPNWHSLRLHRLAAEGIRAQSRYLDAIMAQYGSEKHDHLAYRIARRDAHNADAALSAALDAALREPGYVRRNSEPAIRFLVLSHTLLSYLSALGAHRGARLEPCAEAVAAAEALKSALAGLALALETGRAMPASELPDEAIARQGLAATTADEPEFRRVLRAQLALSLRLLPSLRALAGELAPGRSAAARRLPCATDSR